MKKNFIYVYERHNSKRINLEQGLKSKVNSFTTILKKKLLDRAGKHYDKFVLLSDDHREEWRYLSNLTIINNPLIFYPNDYKQSWRRDCAAENFNCNLFFSILILENPRR